MYSFKTWIIKILGGTPPEPIPPEPIPPEPIPPEPAVDHQHSTTPWVEIVSDNWDPVKGIQIHLDWNSAFIQELMSNGFTGHNEEMIVQKWLSVLYDDLLQDITERNMAEAERTNTSEFE